MDLGLVAGGEEAGGLEDDFGAELAPGQIGRIALLEDADFLAVDDDVLVVVSDIALEGGHGRSPT